MPAPAVNYRIQRTLLWQRPKLCPSKDALTNVLGPSLPLGEVGVAAGKLRKLLTSFSDMRSERRSMRRSLETLNA